MSIISWEKRRDGYLNVWDSPVRGHGRKRVVKDVDAFFTQVKAVSPFGINGITYGDLGFCADPGVFTNSKSFEDRRMEALAHNVEEMIEDWRPVHCNAAHDALMELAGDFYEPHQKLSTWIMKWLQDVASMDDASPIKAHEALHHPETGFDAITRKHRAGSLRGVLEYGVKDVLRTRDFHRIVKAAKEKDVAFKTSFEIISTFLVEYIDLRRLIDGHVDARAAEKRGLRNEIRKARIYEARLKRTKLFELVNGRHPRLGRFGAIYAKELRGLGFEAQRCLALTNVIRERFADVIEVLGVEQVLHGAALD